MSQLVLILDTGEPETIRDALRRTREFYRDAAGASFNDTYPSGEIRDLQEKVRKIEKLLERL